MQKNIIAFKKLKIKITKRKKEKMEKERKKGVGEGKFHRTTKGQCRGRGL